MGTSGPGRDQPRDRHRHGDARLDPDGRDHRQRALRPDRQGRVPGDRHQRHHPADDEAQLPRPRRERAAARDRRGLPHRPHRPARARSTSTSPRTRSSRRPPAAHPVRRRGRSPACRASGPTIDGNYKQLKLAAAEIAAAERPVILAGHGVLHAGAEAELLAFAEKLNAPVAWTLLGIGALDERHPLAYGFMGMHGWKHVNRAIQSADLLFAIGMRFDDRVTGNVRTYAPYARIVHVDIDPAEIGKNVAVEVPDRRRREARAHDAARRWSSRCRPSDARAVPRAAGRVEARLGGQLVARLRRVARRPAVRRLRRPADRRADRARGHLRRRRRPEPDVARPLRRLPPPEHAPELGRPGHDGLRGAGGDGRGARRPGARDLGDRRRRRLPDDARRS